MVRIAVLSDTHDRLPGHVCEAIAGADEVWHLGDVCSPAILDKLTVPGRLLRVVRGNCDENEEWPISLDFELEGFRIRLIHIPPRKADGGLVLHGHTHVPRNEIIGVTRFLNPGCITRPNQGASASFGWLYLERGVPLKWSVEPV